MQFISLIKVEDKILQHDLNEICAEILLDVAVLFSMVYRAKKNFNSSLSFGKAALTSCLPWVTSCSSQLMIQLEDNLLRPLPFGQVNLKVTCPRRKSACAGQPNRKKRRPRLVSKQVFSFDWLVILLLLLLFVLFCLN